MTRRKVLLGGGSSAAALLAGCSGTTGEGSDGGDGNSTASGDGDSGGGNSGDGGDDGSSGDGTDNTAEVTLYRAIGERPDESHMNPFGPGQALFHGERWGRLIFDQFAKFSNNTAETYNEMASDLTIDGDVIDVKMREQTWHNGDPYTTESVKLTYDIQSMIDEHAGEESALTRFVDEIEISDDYAFTFHLTEEWNPSFTVSALLDEQLYALHPDHWTEWRDKLEDAEPGTDEFGSVMDELAEHTPREIKGQQFLGMGPYQVDYVDSTSLVLKTYDDHPNADDIEYDRIEGTVVNDPVMAFVEDETDILALQFPLDSDLQAQAPSDDALDYFTKDLNRTFTWVFNTANDNFPTTTREIRHAMAFAVDQKAAAKTMPDAFEAADWPATWLHWNDFEEGKFDPGQFVTHGTDTDRAAELVNQADGFVYEDGQVLDAETSEQIKADIMVGGRDATNAMARSFVDDLTDFGFDAVLDSVDGATFGSRRSDHDWTTYVDPGSVDYSAYNWRSESMLGWNQNRFGYPNTWEVPMPPGESVNLSPDDGETESFDLTEEIPKMEKTTDQEQINETLHRLAWAFNMYLPAIPVAWRPTAGAVKNDRFTITTDDRGKRHGTGQWYLYRNGYFDVA